MKTMQLEFPVTTLRRAFGVPRSGFYPWANGKPSTRTQADARLKVAIQVVHAQSRQTYGPLEPWYLHRVVARRSNAARHGCPSMALGYRRLWHV
jgi:hypothetical protein